MPRTAYEKAVALDGDLLRAADDAMSNCDEDTPAEEFEEIVRYYARIHKVPRRMLRDRILELLND